MSSLTSVIVNSIMNAVFMHVVQQNKKLVTYISIILATK